MKRHYGQMNPRTNRKYPSSASNNPENKANQNNETQSAKKVPSPRLEMTWNNSQQTQLCISPIPPSIFTQELSTETRCGCDNKTKKNYK